MSFLTHITLVEHYRPRRHPQLPSCLSRVPVSRIFAELHVHLQAALSLALSTFISCPSYDDRIEHLRYRLASSSDVANELTELLSPQLSKGSRKYLAPHGPCYMTDT
jgi:hypothetical protein